MWLVAVGFLRLRQPDINNSRQGDGQDLPVSLPWLVGPTPCQARSCALEWKFGGSSLRYKLPLLLGLALLSGSSLRYKLPRTN
ncbi:hypothetical protein L3X38_017529 [Prunus dulcis]|uniref:Uncharacterized protein n=1 Tax=Prunus dulcis TaxID=3755 RepID=A0AAD4ZAT3_PRUDU|nr:hypothetical protein L3X38_017529 [Prunus dulcis]